MYRVSRVSSIESIEYRLYRVSSVSSIECIEYREYRVFRVSLTLRGLSLETVSISRSVFVRKVDSIVISLIIDKRKAKLACIEMVMFEVDKRSFTQLNFEITILYILVKSIHL